MVVAVKVVRSSQILDYISKCGWQDLLKDRVWSVKESKSQRCLPGLHLSHQKDAAGIGWVGKMGVKQDFFSFLWGVKIKT